jgi:flagellar basal-body rod protein FlgB
MCAAPDGAERAHEAQVLRGGLRADCGRKPTQLPSCGELWDLEDSRRCGTRFERNCQAMFINRLLNQGSSPLLEEVVNFASQRHRLLAENIANVDTPGYRQKDLSVGRFQEMLVQRLEARDRPPGAVRFDDIRHAVDHPTRGILFHDRNNRSMEQLASDLAKNGLMHNVAIELLRKQYQQMDMALKDRVT